MTENIGLLEDLANSNLSICEGGHQEGDNLIVAPGFVNLYEDYPAILVGRTHFDLVFNFRLNQPRGNNRVTRIQTFNREPFVLVTLTNDVDYALFRNHQDMPQNFDYQEIPVVSYQKRIIEIFNAFDMQQK